jgi:hypothetical protein
VLIEPAAERPHARWLRRERPATEAGSPAERTEGAGAGEAD